MKKKNVFIILAMSIMFSFTGCSKVEQIKSTVEAGSILDLTQLFNYKEGISISLKDANSIDMSTAGEYKVTLLIDDGGKTTEEEFVITVEDTTPPDISADDVVIFVGADFIPEDYIAVSDNSLGDIKLDVDSSSVDTSLQGTYSINVKATDPSDNMAEKKVNIQVKQISSLQDVVDYANAITEEKGYKFSYKTGTVLSREVLEASEGLLVYKDFDGDKRSVSLTPKFRCIHDSLGIGYFKVSELRFSCRATDSNSSKLDRGIFKAGGLEFKSSKGSIKNDDATSADFDLGSSQYISDFTFMIDAENVGKMIDVVSGDDLEVNITISDDKIGKKVVTVKLNDEDVKQLRDFLDFYKEMEKIKPSEEFIKKMTFGE